MNERGIPGISIVFGLLSVATFTIYSLLHYDTAGAFKFVEFGGFSRVQFLILGVFGWLTGLAAFWPVTERNQKSALIFAFCIMAVMIFFIHETYQYKGKVRLFPLIIGYTGVALCALDILTTTNTTIGRIVNRLTGSALVADDIVARSVTREIIVCLAMCGCVALIYLFGFLLGGAVFVMLWMLIGGRKSILAALLGGVGTFAFVWLMFEQILNYTLHRGIWTQWFWETYLGVS